IDMLDYGSAGMYLTQTNVSHASADLEIKSLVYNAYASTKTVAVKSVLVDAAANIVATRITNATLAPNSGTTVVQNATWPIRTCGTGEAIRTRTRSMSRFTRETTLDRFGISCRPRHWDSAGITSIRIKGSFSTATILTYTASVAIRTA